MKVLYFDCFSGISGDMVIGAFLDCGVEIKYLEQELAKLNVPGYRIAAEKTTRYGISGTLFRVITDDNVQPHHHHTIGHHGQNHGHSHDNNDTGHTHRSYKDIKEIINSSGLDEAVKKTSLAIFARVAASEAKIHNVPADDVHSMKSVPWIQSWILWLLLCVFIKLRLVYATVLRSM
jgi:uncharacterized protein (DUF111 family)